MSNFKPVKLGKNTRMSFGEINEVMKMPNLLEVQKESYRWFLDVGFKEVFRDIGEITDYSNNLVLTFTDYRMDEQPKYSVTECKQRDITYAAPLYLTAMLYNRETGEVKESKDIYMGDFPIMTESGTFVINGAERVIISQLVRSPGVYYAFTFDKNGKKNFTSTVIPSRGAWLEYETDSNDIFNVKIDKNRKVPITTFVRALGLSSNNDIREFFGDDDRIEATLEKDNTQNTEEALLEVYKHLRPGEPPTLETAQAQLQALFFDPRRYDISRVGRYKFNKKLSLVDRIAGGTLADDVIDPMTGEVLAEAGDTLNKDKAEKIDRSGVKVVVLDVDGKAVKVISNNMVDPLDFLKGVKREQFEAAGISEKVRFSVLKEILDACGDDKKAVLEQFKERADELVPKHIIIDDIFASVNYLNCLGNELGNVDDIDHLGNRRIRCVGELLQNQLRIGFTRMERPVRDKLGLQSQEGGLGTPKEFVNVKPVMAAIKEFFGSSPLSQFMDQTNPLAELTHKRRLSALGPGGLSRDRAGFEVRDVHYSHYGRMCPIETPEGPNIGLISYLATFARINKYGFVEAPYRKIDKKTGCVLEEVEYMTADVEDNFSVAQANEPLDKDGHFLNSRVTVRYHDEFREVDPSVPDYMDVSPKMLVSVATAMIPFLENDDANRALMGANMQRQAVPLLKTESPIVGTGMEFKAAQDSGVVVLAEHDGVVTRTSADKVEVQTKDGKTDV
ncbi:MAG: DNA-directed RNA polymerase subunit beta, partial [Clostridia bacterium]|nr:DNA-directed RNA polymerase subunit beta [Clostridia bacterium]